MGVRSGSVDPEASAVTGSGAVPELGVTVRAATGAASATVTVAVLLAGGFTPSVTVTLTVKAPAPLYWWVVVGVHWVTDGLVWPEEKVEQGDRGRWRSVAPEEDAVDVT